MGEATPFVRQATRLAQMKDEVADQLMKDIEAIGAYLQRLLSSQKLLVL
jgi:hypothetical protein